MMGLCDIFRRRGGQAEVKAPKSALAREVLANAEGCRQLRLARVNGQPITFTDVQGRQRRLVITSALKKNSHS